MKYRFFIHPVPICLPFDVLVEQEHILVGALVHRLPAEGHILEGEGHILEGVGHDDLEEGLGTAAEGRSSVGRGQLVPVGVAHSLEVEVHTLGVLVHNPGVEEHIPGVGVHCNPVVGVVHLVGVGHLHLEGVTGGNRG